MYKFKHYQAVDVTINMQHLLLLREKNCFFVAEECKIVHRGLYLNGAYLVTWYPLSSIDECWIFCLNDPRCRNCQMSLYGNDCEINSMTSAEHPAGVVIDPFYTMYEKC